MPCADQYPVNLPRTAADAVRLWLRLQARECREVQTRRVHLRFLMAAAPKVWPMGQRAQAIYAKRVGAGHIHQASPRLEFLPKCADVSHDPPRKLEPFSLTEWRKRILPRKCGNVRVVLARGSSGAIQRQATTGSLQLVASEAESVVLRSRLSAILRRVHGLMARTSLQH